MARPALSASRAVTLLNFLAAHPTEAFTLSELAARLDVNASSLHALCNALIDAGYVSRHPRQRTFTLGPAVVALGSAAIEANPVIDVTRDAARELARETGLEVAVTAVAGRQIVFLARAGHHSARGFPIHVGQQVPFAPPLGAVFVAWGDDGPWLEESADPDQLRRVLRGVRQRGYAVAVEADARRALGEALGDLADMPSHGPRHDLVATLAELGHQAYQLEYVVSTRRYDVSMVSAPVFGTAGDVVLALTLVGFAPAMRGSQVAALGERLRDAGLVVTRRSRGRVPRASG
jgi:DNA-binding IclR family transcriptional regulator